MLVGNPNVGKSLLFKHLTNHYVTVSNYPGTTVEIVRARAAFGDRGTTVVDTPGINDLEPHTDDARVTRRVIDEHHHATIVQVADAKNLRRALLLTAQLADLHRPMALVLNMKDELAARGGAVDVARLETLLGIPVVQTIATTGEGVPDLVAALDRARPAISIAADETRITARLEAVNAILADTYHIAEPAHPSFSVRLGFWAMHPLRGLALLALVLLGVFWFVGLFGAGSMVDLLEVGVFEQRLTPLAIELTDAVLPFPHTHVLAPVSASVALPVTPVHDVTVIELHRTVQQVAYSVSGSASFTPWQQAARVTHDFLVGQYGIITMALSYALAIVLPIVTTFFLVFSILEDSGYFPRMATMLNRVFRFMGLNGRAVLPMILGLGCDTMATMTTRILETRKERIVTTMLLALAVPCSAQLGVLLAMTATITPVATVAWLAIVASVILFVGWATARLVPGETSEFILEIPPMRRPQLSNVVRKTVSRLNWYLREVIPMFVIGTALLFVLDQFGLLTRIAHAGEPLVTGWLGLPAETANAFLIGFMRRDFGAVYLLDAATGPGAILTAHQVFVAMVTITLFIPCFANFLMIAKEHGSRVAWGMAAFIFPFAFFVGGIVHRIGTWLTIF